MTPDELLALLGFLFPLAYSPGPGNAFFAAIGSVGGWRAAVSALAGYHLATLLVTTAVGLGFGLALVRDERVARALAAAGAAYVAWMAVQPLRSARQLDGPAVPDPATGTGRARAREATTLDGAVVLLLNPKAYAIIAALFSRFPTPGRSGAVEVLAVATAFTLNNLVAFVAWTFGGAALATLFRGPRAGARLHRAFAIALLLVAAWMAVPLLR